MQAVRPVAPFRTILNFRDVGASVNKLRVGKPRLLREGLLFRSANLDDASPEDTRRLSEEFKIANAIDLRAGPGEAQNAPRSRTIPTRFLNLHGEGYSRGLLTRLSWPRYLQMGLLALVGRQLASVRFLGRHAMSPRGLGGLAIDTLRFSGPEIGRVFTWLAHKESYPVQLLCQQGKDRTGLLVILVQMLLDVPMETIERDYMLSQVEVDSVRDERVKELVDMGLPPGFVDCDPALPEKVKDWISRTHGGIRSYLEQAGVGRGDQQKIRDTLLEPQ